MQKLTAREEDIMQEIWKLEKAFIRDVVDAMPKPKPHYNTVSTIIKILEEKGFLAHEKFGKMYRYFPLISKDTYQQSAIGEVVQNYFDNSYLNIVTYFAKKEKISEEELKAILDLIKNQKK